MASSEIISPNHWKVANYVQRMTAKEWRQILLDKEDNIIFQGHPLRLIAKNIGYGVVEVSKELRNETQPLSTD
jgi:hypothetical protein